MVSTPEEREPARPDERERRRVSDLPGRPALSAREVEVMLAWIARDSKAEVCRDLHIALGTMNTHLTRIREKYDRAGRSAPTKAALMARALQDGHLSIHDL